MVDTCSIAFSDLFNRPFGMAYPLRIPQGSGRTFYPANHAWTVAWNTRAGANVNLGTSGWGDPIWDATTNRTMRTITRGPHGHPGDGLPVTVPIPNSMTDVGPGTDRGCAIYDGNTGLWHSFWQLYLNTVTPNWTAAYYTQNSAKQTGLDPRFAPSASGIAFPMLALRGYEWHPELNPPRICQHAIGVAVEGFGGGNNDILGTGLAWPAKYRDTGYTSNQGPVPYGAWLAMPLPAEGGPTPASIGLTTVFDLAVYNHLVNYGMVICDQGGNITLGADQLFTSTMRTSWMSAEAKCHSHLRFVSNVGVNGSNPIGGGTPLSVNCGFDATTAPPPPTPQTTIPIGGGSPIAPNCAYDNSSNLDINPVSWWSARLDMASDLTFWTPYYTSGDSAKYYTLGLGIDGHTAMYRATGNTIYLDRALLYVNRMITDATTQAGGYKGWLSSDDGNTEAPLREFYCWRYVCNMLEAMVGLTGTYATQYATILAFTEQNIWNKWYSRSVNNNIYRQVVHIAAHSAFVAYFLRRRASSSTVKSQAADVQDNIDFLGLPNYGDSIRSMMQPHYFDANAYYWEMYFRDIDLTPQASQPQSDRDWGSDVSHGSGTLSYIVEMYDHGYQWVYSDIAKFMRTLSIIWPDSTTYYNWMTGGTPRPGISTPSPLTWAGTLQDGFLKLGRYDRGLQQRIEGQTVAPGAQLYGNGALNAKFLLK